MESGRIRRQRHIGKAPRMRRLRYERPWASSTGRRDAQVQPYRFDRPTTEPEPSCANWSGQTTGSSYKDALNGLIGLVEGRNTAWPVACNFRSLYQVQNFKCS